VNGVLRRLIAWLLAPVIGSMLPGAAVIAASAHTYDAPAVERGDVHQLEAAEAGQYQLSDARLRSASISTAARGTSTTSRSLVNATNTVRYGPHNPGPLVDDVASTFRSGSYSQLTLAEDTVL